jgi:hypothetical protein
MEYKMKIGTVELELFSKENSYNNSNNSERMVEIPLAEWFLKRCNYDPTLIEVGAVTPYYFNVAHLIYDPYDIYEKCIKIRAEYIGYREKTLLSISTIEHICKSEADYNKPIEDDDTAVNVLLNMMSAKEYVITFPRRFNECLDNFAEQENEHIIKLKRTQPRTWEHAQSLNDVWFNVPYPCGNGLYIVTNCKELL